MRSGLVCAALVAALAVAGNARAEIVVTLDLRADRHPVSPLIYGMAFPTDAQIDGGAVTVARWGGNSTSRYNFEVDVHNTGADWYFENIPGCFTKEQGWCKTPPSDPKEQSTANLFLSHASDRGLVSLFTVPTLGWVAKGPPRYRHPFVCGCTRRVAPAQAAFDPYEPGCGNGKARGGKSTVPCAGPDATSQPADPAFVKRWIEYLVAKHGPSNGRRIYALDNEPSLWSTTHRDVRRARLGYDELWQRTRDYATAILEADPTAEIAGPAEWGYPAYFCSDADDLSKACSAASPDRARHGGEELVAWLLDRAREHEAKTGRRILHYLDLHYYPQADRPPENTRSLWDPSYKDPSWLNDTVRLLPRMREWVMRHYPGTKTALGEYDFHHHSEPVGAVAYAEVLGLFGREGLDLATAWSPPAASDAAFSAYRLYRNFDGKGGQFEATSVRASVSGAGSIAAFAAVGPSRLTVALMAEAKANAVRVALGTFHASGTAALYVGAPNGTVVRRPDIAIRGGTALVDLPATSIAMLVIEGTDPAHLPAAREADAATLPADGGATSPAATLAPRATRACTTARGPGSSPPHAAAALALALVLAHLRQRARRRCEREWAAPMVDKCSPRR